MARHLSPDFQSSLYTCCILHGENRFGIFSEIHFQTFIDYHYSVWFPPVKSRIDGSPAHGNLKAIRSPSRGVWQLTALFPGQGPDPACLVSASPASQSSALRTC